MGNEVIHSMLFQLRTAMITPNNVRMVKRDDNTLSLSHRGKYAVINYDAGHDTYNVELLKLDRKTMLPLSVSEREGLYGDSMPYVVARHLGL
jgi:hypothetical protein